MLAIPKVIAHEGNDDPNLVHGCISSLTLGLRVVDVGTDCSGLETPIHFPATLDQLPPFVCPGCNLQGVTALKNKNLANAWLMDANISNGDFEGTIFRNVDFIGVAAEETNFAGADMTGASFQNVGLTDATGMTSTILTDVTWSNTICPDGTNSNDNSNTCIGHLTP